MSEFSKWVCSDCETIFYVPVTIEPKFCPVCRSTKIECCCDECDEWGGGDPVPTGSPEHYRYHERVYE